MKLQPWQQEALRLNAQSVPNDEIAQRLGVSLPQVSVLLIPREYRRLTEAKTRQAPPPHPRPQQWHAEAIRLWINGWSPPDIGIVVAKGYNVVRSLVDPEFREKRQEQQNQRYAIDPQFRRRAKERSKRQYHG